MGGTLKRMAANRRFDADTVRAIRNANGSYRSLSLQFNCSPESIKQIRLGLTYRDLLEEEESRAVPSCLRCIHCLNKRCTMNFPEFSIVGHWFARDCSAYMEQGAEKLSPVAS